MKIINFLPLLIWALGFLWLDSWTDKWKNSNTYSKPENDDAEATHAAIFLIGVVLFLFIGVAICRGWL